MSDLKVYEMEREGATPLERARVGDWYWVTFEKDEWDEDKEETVVTGTYEELMCIAHVGSNHFVLRKSSKYGSSSCQIHFDDFENECREEPNWKHHINSEMQRLQLEMKELMAKMLEEGRSLALLPEEHKHEAPVAETTLPAVATTSPKKHQQDLVEFQKRLPEMQKEIGELAEEFAITAKDLALPDMIQLDRVKKSLAVVEDRIFNLELYCGLQEEVHRIADGEPAPIDTPVTIMQQLLYMDEESLFDYDDGGMDYSSLGEWDEWVVRPENLKRLAPHPRCIVGFRVRRNKKERGEISTFAQAWVRMCEEMADMETYLLIRNGEKVYRIASPVDFSPRLVPKRDELGEAQFLKVHRSYNWDKRKDDVTEEKIGPDHMDYDEHVEKLDNAIKHYNRVIILLQGIFDRTDMFMPHIGVKLTENDHMDKWVKVVRDEEDGLPNNRVTWEEYKEQLNKSIKKGKKVWSKWYPDDYGRYANYNSNYKYFTVPEEEIVRRPRVCEVTSIRKDRSEVRISFEVKRHIYGRYRGYEWIDSHEKVMKRGLWVPIEKVFNVSDYTIGDYKMFLCDRSLRGEYLKWAQPLLTAEDEARKEQGRDVRPKSKKKGWQKKKFVNHNGDLEVYECTSGGILDQEEDE